MNETVTVLKLTIDELVPMKIAVDKGIESMQKMLGSENERSKELNSDGTLRYKHAAENADVLSKWIEELEKVKGKIYEAMGVTQNEDH